MDQQSCADVDAFIASVATKFGRERDARRHDHGAVSVIRYPRPIEHTWPRMLHFRVELFSRGASREALGAVITERFALHREEHVVVDFHAQPETRRPHLEALGYSTAWVTELLAKDLDDDPVRSPPAPSILIRPVTTEHDARAIEAIDPERQGGRLALDASELHDFVLTADGAIVAHAQIVTADPEIAYVAEMRTVEGHRRQGHGRRLLGTLEAAARRLGRRRLILIPSLMAARFGFYRRLGYRGSLPAAVLIPAVPVAGS